MASERSSTFEFKITMPQEVQAGDERPSTTSQGRKSTFRTGARPRGKLGENVAQYNFKSMAKLGLGIRQSRMMNEIVGNYTNNKIRQQKINKHMLFATYAIGVGKFGVFGALYAGGDIGYRVAMHNISQGKKQREATEQQRISGNNAFNGIRRGGRYL